MRTKIASLILLLASLSLAAGQQKGPSPVGKPAPALQVGHWLNTKGAPLSLDKLKGKVVVLDFWAFW
ncbi:TlpA family protein disulfide reductase [Fimbriimonas ginsengisoli]|uniref:Redoxin domain-containing protein n=1 Tax=Fimbriimonas ginsengisoli Gsoil 348 TaxID=661478 RepID=A0A068NYU6_FIMGI|nr:hypothetical protein [Fimbriimonas ginsengisoli]AIE87439.1 hypothetical protein OP10G_4071 [Fimbriimonas ginsengisoli Gsoil 348]